MGRFIISTTQDFTGSYESETYLKDQTEFVYHSGYLYNGGGRDLTIDEYIQLKNGTVKVISGEALDKLFAEYHQSQYPLDQLTKIEQAQFEQMLEILPPVDWQYTEGLETFLMSEFLCGSVTTQFIRVRLSCVNHYFKKYVNTRQPETFFSMALLNTK